MRPALEHPNVTLLTNAKAVKLETNEAGTAVTEVVVEREGEEERFAGDVVVVSCGAANSAMLLPALGERQASEWPRQRLGPGRSQLHVPRQRGRARAVDAKRTRPSSRRPWGSTTSTSAATISSIRSATSRWSASRRRPCSGARSQGRRSWPPSGPWSGSPATRSTSGCPPRTFRGRTTGSIVDRDGNAHAQLHGDERRSEEAALRQAQVDARPPRHAPRPPVHQARLHEERHPGCGMCPPGGHLPLRRRPGQLGARHRTARRTSSTTSTSSTPASSPASAPSTRRSPRWRTRSESGDHLLERLGTAART